MNMIDNIRFIKDWELEHLMPWSIVGFFVLVLSFHQYAYSSSPSIVYSMNLWTEEAHLGFKKITWMTSRQDNPTGMEISSDTIFISNSLADKQVSILSLSESQERKASQNGDILLTIAKSQLSISRNNISNASVLTCYRSGKMILSESIGQRPNPKNLMLQEGDVLIFWPSKGNLRKQTQMRSTVPKDYQDFFASIDASLPSNRVKALIIDIGQVTKDKGPLGRISLPELFIKQRWLDQKTDTPTVLVKVGENIGSIGHYMSVAGIPNSPQLYSIGYTTSQYDITAVRNYIGIVDISTNDRNHTTMDRSQPDGNKLSIHLKSERLFVLRSGQIPFKISIVRDHKLLDSIGSAGALETNVKKGDAIFIHPLDADEFQSFSYHDLWCRTAIAKDFLKHGQIRVLIEGEPEPVVPSLMSNRGSKNFAQYYQAVMPSKATVFGFSHAHWVTSDVDYPTGILLNPRDICVGGILGEIPTQYSTPELMEKFVSSGEKESDWKIWFRIREDRVEIRNTAPNSYLSLIRGITKKKVALHTTFDNVTEIVVQDDDMIEFIPDKGPYPISGDTFDISPDTFWRYLVMLGTIVTSAPVNVLSIRIGNVKAHQKSLHGIRKDLQRSICAQNWFSVKDEKWLIKDLDGPPIEEPALVFQWFKIDYKSSEMSITSRSFLYGIRLTESAVLISDQLKDTNFENDEDKDNANRQISIRILGRHLFIVIKGNVPLAIVLQRQMKTVFQTCEEGTHVIPCQKDDQLFIVSWINWTRDLGEAEISKLPIKSNRSALIDQLEYPSKNDWIFTARIREAKDSQEEVENGPVETITTTLKNNLHFKGH